ncbi:hypothetical protein GUITHDRAFT_112658 [Guillardia theta CCMP2712]|uniref:Uncharacterized protein n=1 Tax=Guillardia theta (strain CCMP2712) TaxID=905079 RepID=L1IZ56_GUITC|nr:hypothetical protein GUITHDRAFT_112658 [Guillardia theta CCMP2712]EKX41184.1 hypothetical protein GUITHDRAFT_112658 [Guillardia theta CCMP2712]|eukprot:XP_005828164.1 hypothetical protein GUITHDRAFT_112658 [Guillardia theta CCMP2712]
MALPNYEAVKPMAPIPRGGKATRVAAIATSVVFVLLAVAGLLGRSSHRSSLLVSPSEQSLRNLALEFLRNGDKMTVTQMKRKLDAWHNSPSTLLDLDDGEGAKTQMLAEGYPRLGTELAEDSTLCKKKDYIIEKFDQLLKKLGGEELSANITMGKVSDEWKQALSSWLDSESTYRLTIEKAKEAREGADFARNEYEKWNTAYKQAKKDYDDTLARHAAERQDILDERELIKEIMRLLGVLSDIKATDKSIAAGGRDSIKDPNTGVSDPYNMKEDVDKTRARLMQKRLEKLATTTLPIYSETEEVAKILKEMLDDLDTRMNIIDEVDAKAKKLVEDAEAKLVEWEQQLVSLSNAADKATEKMSAAQLEREKLAGDKTISESTYNDEKAAYTLEIPPYQREIYVITMIKIKIIEHCNGADNTSA